MIMWIFAQMASKWTGQKTKILFAVRRARYCSGTYMGEIRRTNALSLYRKWVRLGRAGAICVRVCVRHLGAKFSIGVVRVRANFFSCCFRRKLQLPSKQTLFSLGFSLAAGAGAGAPLSRTKYIYILSYLLPNFAQTLASESKKLINCPIFVCPIAAAAAIASVSNCSWRKNVLLEDTEIERANNIGGGRRRTIYTHFGQYCALHVIIIAMGAISLVCRDLL